MQAGVRVSLSVLATAVGVAWFTWDALESSDVVAEPAELRQRPESNKTEGQREIACTT